jgi:hypothetical protein
MKLQIADKVKIIKNSALKLKNRADVFVKKCDSTLKAGGRDRNRLLVIFFSLLFLLDYILYCVHTEKFVFDIFPPLPVFAKTQNVTVYLPSTDGATILEEKRDIPVFDNEEKYASYLFYLVRNGSVAENTIIAVPVDLHIKDIWFHSEEGAAAKTCVINIDPVIAEPGIKAAKGSEILFKTAVEKTITSIMPTVKKVYVQERGIPGKNLWEMI